MTDTLTALTASVTAALPELIEIRRDLHAHPELARLETRTTDVVADRLEVAGISVARLPGTGLVAELGAEQPAYRVALRADMDALPVQERTGLPYASVVDGATHACGHDVHVTALLGAMLALKEHEQTLRERGTAVRAIFQAAEEVIPGGAHEAIAAGVMEGVDAIFAVHCDPSLDVGQVGLREGAITAACDHLTVRLTGHGGHTSRPQLTEDLTYALAKVITDVPAALSRRLDPRAGAALVWGSVHSGSASNVIPSEGECTGGPLLDEIVRGVVAPYGVEARLERIKGVPPVVNQADAIDALRFACLGSGLQIAPTQQSLGGEDYSWYLSHAPGAMARLGTRTPGGRTYDLHQGDVVIDEDAIKCGAQLLASVVVAHTVKASGESVING